MGRAKTISLVVLGLLVIIVTLQNTETVQTRILFATIAMPRAVLLFITLAAGFVLGLLAGLRLARKEPTP